ncbi:hypothetical protein CEY16_01830 [Halalkalibacillus sediminis]|uniref:endopeptidase La n=1 Tax=Halalkalibacillus sediminis TaxID=2018042 RepID=A0A2I0QWN8_9BACI|nr:SepM family pheromone-processing serine protease [Halalkalibacillus sediminis]PKR78520.1 hypothetical protein CEY16_01830 [Halalkalibacillus sediminis]
MLLTRKQFIFLLITLVVAIFLSYYKIDYYIYQPGDTRALNDVVQIDEGFDSEGDMHLVTVRGGQATPLYYLWAQLRTHYDIYDLEDIRPEGISQDEYMETQLHFMESSQEAATVVAYEAAEKDITIEYKGVYVVAVIEDMPAKGHLEPGDRIIEVEGKEIDSDRSLTDQLNEMSPGDEVELKVLRDEMERSISFELGSFPDEPERAGMGVSLVTDRDVTVNPEVNFDSGTIGGPSAGMMFSLEIYDQLTEEDITKGRYIAGTGEVDYEGNVYRIGGIDKKVVAADKDGADIFFAPNENGKSESNYEVAKATAEEIETSMEIVPVDTFSDALEYLEGLE